MSAPLPAAVLAVFVLALLPVYWAVQGRHLRTARTQNHTR